ncbi:MAG TPA: DUF3455 domain-containing protein [Acidobacteriaceae bacterium]|nr:DUF3455 domain-containing protein [Acidobacteriaceae bacterium]
MGVPESQSYTRAKKSLYTQAMRSVIRTILLLTTCSALSLVAQAQDTTQPPPNQHPILTVTGKGVQIYTCQQAPTGSQWVFQAPEAILTDSSGTPVGTHGAGPIWKSKDGSTVKGDVLQKSASPDPAAIPWLLLKATTSSGSGIMSHVEYIRRSETHGGIAPTTACDAGHLNASARVPYTATYTFYSAKP